MSKIENYYIGDIVIEKIYKAMVSLSIKFFKPNVMTMGKDVVNFKIKPLNSFADLLGSGFVFDEYMASRGFLVKEIKLNNLNVEIQKLKHKGLIVRGDLDPLIVKLI